jgi:cell division protein FtsL
MARALRATTPQSSPASKGRTQTQRRAGTASPRRAGAPGGSTKANPRTITTRTSKDRAKHSPIARVVNRRDAPAPLRRFVFIAVGVALVAIMLMMVVVVFQTRLAETQLGIDDIESQIATERSRYDELRLERSILREPERLVAEAGALGMVPGSKTDFRAVDPLAVAEVLVSTSGADLQSVLGNKDSLERYRVVKEIIGDPR